MPNQTACMVHAKFEMSCLILASIQDAIGLPDIALAVWRELGKRGKPVAPGDLGPLAAHRQEVAP